MKLFFILYLLVVIACSSNGAIFTNSPSADAFVRSNVPALNYGGAGSSSVSGASATNGAGGVNGASDTLMRFNTAAMVANFNSLFGASNWVVTGAKLRVFEQAAPPNGIFNRGVGAFEIRWIANDSWTEGTGTPAAPSGTGVNYNSETTLLNSGTDTSLGVFTNAGADTALSFALPLTAAFTGDIAAGGEVGFFMTAIDATTGFTFYSRSFTTNSFRPFLDISAEPRPGTVTMNLSGANIVITGTNGGASGTYYILSSTNLSTPLNQWTRAATNVLGANGNFSFTATNAANSSASQQFFILQTQ